MPQDAVTLKKTAAELNIFFSGGKINKITEPSQDEIVMSVYTRFGTAKLAVCINAVGTRVGITALEKKSPSTPPAFCMLLRKHLLNSTLKSIETIKNERIVKIAFDGKNEFSENVEKELYCEIMGKYSNAILCENEIILGTQKVAALDLNKERALIAGVKYSLPKSQGKNDMTDKNEFLKTMENFTFGNLSEFMFNNFSGVSIATARELVTAFFGEENFVMSDIKTSEFYDFIIDFINSPIESANVVVSQNKLLDFYFCDYKSVQGEKKFFDCLTDAETFFYDNKYLLRTQSEVKNKLLSAVNSHLKKEEKKLQIIAEKELAAEGAEKERWLGELLTANIYKVKRGDKFIVVEDYYNDNSPIKITLDDSLSPNQNAQKYFKKYVKLKNTIKAIMPQKEQTLSQTKYLKSVISEIDSAESIEDFEEITTELKESGILKNDEIQKKKKQTEKINYRTFKYDGYKIIAGKNNIQNDKLTSSAKPSDMWLHTKDYHSAHVIIESNGKHIEGDILLIAAEICAFYSEASKGDKVPVDYTLKKYVKKPPKSNFGSVLYTDFKTILVTPDSHKNLEI